MTKKVKKELTPLTLFSYKWSILKIFFRTTPLLLCYVVGHIMRVTACYIHENRHRKKNQRLNVLCIKMS